MKISSTVLRGAVGKGAYLRHLAGCLPATNDGRKLALDQRLINPLLPENEDGKVAACAEKVCEIYEQHQDTRGTQMIFCDLSTPKNDGSFNVYDEMKKKLTAKGIPEAEIAFIHDANTDVRKKELFTKVRAGQVRVLLGSTAKMGAGTNVQRLLVANHDIDCPWRPSDLEQRAGRIVRQGNLNPEVSIYRYVTENTFDAYLYQLVEGKQKFISQIMTGKSPARTAEDIDEAVLSYAEIKALATGNPLIKEKMQLDTDVSRLKLLKASHLNQKYALEDAILKTYPAQIKRLTERIKCYEADIQLRDEQTHPNEDGFSPLSKGLMVFTEKKEAGAYILKACSELRTREAMNIGEYRGFQLLLDFDVFAKEHRISMAGSVQHIVSLGADAYGNITRLDNALNNLEKKMTDCRDKLQNTEVQLENAKAEAQKPFKQEEELKIKLTRLSELDALLNLDQKEAPIIATGIDDQDKPETPALEKAVGWER